MIRKLNDYGELMRIKMQMKESLHQYIHGTLALIAIAHFDAEARGLFFYLGMADDQSVYRE